MRQTDPLFQNMLNSIRVMPKLPPEVMQYLQACVVTDEQHVMPENAYILAASHDLVAMYNDIQMARYAPAGVEVLTLKAEHELNNKDLVTPGDWSFALARLDDQSEMPRTLQLFVGAPVLVTQNMNTKRGLFNGVEGVVAGVNTDNHGVVKSIVVKTP